jgi:hypothetical protein
LNDGNKYKNQILTVRHPILLSALRKMGPLAPAQEKVGAAHSWVSGVLRAAGGE